MIARTRKCATYLAFFWVQEITDQGEAAGDRNPNEILEKSAAAFEALVLFVNLGAGLSHQNRRILQKIHAAFVALAAVALLVRARGTLETKSVVAASAECRHVAHRLATLRAFHPPILVREGARDCLSERTGCARG